jgi:TPR repeat protein
MEKDQQWHLASRLPYGLKGRLRAGGTDVRGLLSRASTDFLVAYSAAPGQYAYNNPGKPSIFTATLAEEIIRPGQLIDVMFRVRQRVIAATGSGSRGPQQPELLSRLGHGIALVADGSDARAQEMVFWNDIPRLPNPAAGYRAYLERVQRGEFPGTFAELARAHLESAPVSAALPVQSLAPTPSGLPPEQECDRLAQPPRMGPRYPAVQGVLFEKLDGQAAQQACERALREYPAEPRFKAYLGRAFERLNKADRALALYREAAAAGNPVAQANLGTMYALGSAVPKNDTEAVKWFRLAAEQGYFSGQVSLGFMYAKGTGVPQSDTEAVKWYRLAAEQGDGEGQSNLGFMYEIGTGVPQSDTEAVKWYRLAAEQGNADGQVNLGLMYEKGKGVPQSYSEALKLFRLAVDQGDAHGEFILGVMYEMGAGVPQSRTDAVKWYRLAASQGDAEAQTRLKELGETF